MTDLHRSDGLLQMLLLKQYKSKNRFMNSHFMKPRHSTIINIFVLRDKAIVEQDMTASCRASNSLQFVVMSSLIWRYDFFFNKSKENMQISQISTSPTIIKKKPPNDGGCPQKSCVSVMRYLIEILGFLALNMFNALILLFI
jgi:hypothetical protein